MTTLTEEQKEVIRKLNHSLYTVEYLQEWINRDDNVITNAPAALQAVAASGYLAAVDAILDRISETDYKFYWKDKYGTGTQYLCIEKDGDLVTSDIYIIAADLHYNNVSKTRKDAAEDFRERCNGAKYIWGGWLDGTAYYENKLNAGTLEEAKRELLEWYLRYLKNLSENLLASSLRSSVEQYQSLKSFLESHSL